MTTSFTALRFSRQFIHSVLVKLALFLLISSLAQAQQILTVAGGNGDGPALNQVVPNDVVLDEAGFLYVTDGATASTARIVKFPPNSTSATSGSIVAGGNGRGTATNQFGGTVALALDKAGYIYVADRVNDRVLKFPPTSTSATAGTIVAGGNGRGAGLNQLDTPRNIEVDGTGYIYVCDYSNGRVLKFPPNSTSATLGTVVKGNLGLDVSMTVDKSNNLYVGTYDSGSSVETITKYPPNSTTATSGTIVSQARNIVYDRLRVDGEGNIYMTVQLYSEVYRQPYTSSTQASRVTIATGGSAINQVNSPRGVFVDAAGFLYIADCLNYRVQRYSPTVAVIVDQPVNNYCTNPGSTVTATVNAEAFPTLTYQWYKNNLSSPVSGQTSPTLSLTNVQVSDIGSYSVVISANGKSVTSTAFNLNVVNLIDTQPTSRTYNEGQSAQFMSTAVNGSTFQWQADVGSGFVNLINNTTYSGVNSATLNVASLNSLQSGNVFRVTVSNGTCLQLSSTARLTVNPAPDLISILYARPTGLYGNSLASVVVDIVELNGVASTGLITLRITQDSKLSLTLPPNATSVGSRPVNNSVWTLSGPTSGYYVLTTNQSVPAGDKLSVGLTGNFSGGASGGSLTVSSVLVAGSGGDGRVANNIDADKIDYFQQ